MGVHALWDVIGPTAKPVRLESLSNKRLAVDASIWIYQFLKAVRDKEGNAMRYSHVIGFFRRICKLLYFGIKPVFVFDGGAPALKRRTIQQRKERRQGRRENAASTAKKLLALQMQNGAGKGSHSKPKSSAQTHVHRQDDEYDLPKIPGFKYDETDTRINADDFKTIMDSIDELDGVDLDAINPASKEFDELPKSTQYMILSALRLKSRLRMGYSKEQLEEIFPDSMDFSRFQIDMVKRRNFFTQKLMSATNTHDGGASKLDNDPNQRVAGQKGKQYQLIRTENGWALSLTGNDGSEISKAIVLDESKGTQGSDSSKTHAVQDSRSSGIEDEEEDVDWEDVDIEHKEEEKPLDYSVKAALLPVKANVVQRGGGQSFLDRRSMESRAPDSQSKVVYISEEPVQNDEDGEEDDFMELTKELKMMENVRKSNIKKPSTVYIGSSDVEEGDIEAERQPSRKDEVGSNSEKMNDVDNTKALSDNHLDLEKPAERKQRLETKKSEDEQYDPVHEQDEESAQITSFVTPSYPDKSTQTHNFEDQHDRGDSVKYVTESEQNLQFVLDRISNSDNSQPTYVANIPPDRVESPQRDQDQEEVEKPETPLWFKSAGVSDFNPHLGTSFLTSNVEKEPAQTEDEKLGLLTGSRAAEVLSSRSARNEMNDQQNDNLDSDDDVLEVIPDKEENPVDSSTRSVQEDVENETHMESQKEVPVVDYDFSEDEEDALVNQLREEEDDYNMFKSSLNPSSVNSTFVDEEITNQQKRDKRDSDEVTAAMVSEVQELLTRFGIPYMTAPMEAEAQCAELLALKLVDGIITDDSDIFLFGGDKVYKNMFHEKNYVEYYVTELIKRELGLDREKFIEMAQLLGSDYTSGVKSVGPVSAMEILAEFGDLTAFRDWYNAGQFSKKIQEQESSFEKKLRKKLVTNEVMLDSDFPSELVKEAYIRPEVDHDTTKFTWGVPDLDKLRSFFQSTVSWPQEKTDEVMIPLIREVKNRKKTGVQNTLSSFFPTEYIKTGKDLKLGKRIKNASGKLKQKRQRTM